MLPKNHLGNNLRNSPSLCIAPLLILITAAFLWLGMTATQTIARVDEPRLPPGTFPGTRLGVIPDGVGSPPQFGEPLVIEFEVSGIQSFLNAISIELQMSHTWTGDLEMILRSPNNLAQHSIVNRIGKTTPNGAGDSSNFDGNYTFHDYTSGNIWTTATASTCGTDCVIPSGTYRTTDAGSGTPTNFLAAFSGLTSSQINGKWTLTIRDAAPGDTGAITAANLTILSYVDPPTPTPPNTTPTPTPTITPTPYPEIDLLIAQTAAPEAIRVGQRLTYKITPKIVPSVLGGSAGPQIRFNYPINLPFVFNNAYGSNNYTATADANGVTFSGGFLATGGTSSTVDLYVVLTPQAAGTLTSPGGNVIIDPNNQIGEASETNNTAQTITTTVLPPTIAAKKSFDFDGDRRSDVAVFRPDGGAWYLQQSSGGFSGAAFGLSNDKLVPADYDGDGKTDVAVYRGGNWYLQRSAQGFTGVSFGDSNDIPAPADYDGDGKTDFAVFRPSNGYWYVQGSTAGFSATLFGTNGDKPVAADYDGDGKTDIAVNRAGIWYIQQTQAGLVGISFGDENDKLIPADYDGDGHADLAVFRPSNGYWYLMRSSVGFAAVPFGLGTDIPVPADYDGDGQTDIAIFRTGNWYLNRSAQGFAAQTFGMSGDRPIPASFVP